MRNYFLCHSWTNPFKSLTGVLEWNGMYELWMARLPNCSSSRYKIRSMRESHLVFNPAAKNALFHLRKDLNRQTSLCKRSSIVCKTAEIRDKCLRNISENADAKLPVLDTPPRSVVAHTCFQCDRCWYSKRAGFSQDLRQQMQIAQCVSHLSGMDLIFMHTVCEIHFEKHNAHPRSY